MNDTFGRGRNRLETTATVMVILLSAVASLWMVRDATSAQTEAGRPPTSARTQPTRPTRPAPAALPTEPLSVEGATLKGDMRAGVALIVYSDFECPFCSRFALDTWPSLEQKYVSTGKVRVAFRHLPIESIHRYALKASEAAACADQQAKFWPMHDVLFKNPKQLDDASLAKYAKELKLDGSGVRIGTGQGSVDRHCGNKVEPRFTMEVRL